MYNFFNFLDALNPSKSLTEHKSSLHRHQSRYPFKSSRQIRSDLLIRLISTMFAVNVIISIGIIMNIRKTELRFDLVQLSFISKMFHLERLAFVLLLISVIRATPLRTERQIDFNAEAEYDDADGTKFIAEAVMNVWRSQTGSTQVDGTAKIMHQSFSGAQDKTKYSGKLHVYHDWTKPNHFETNNQMIPAY